MKNLKIMLLSVMEDQHLRVCVSLIMRYRCTIFISHPFTHPDIAMTPDFVKVMGSILSKEMTPNFI